MNEGESAETFAARKQRNIEKHYNGNGMGTPLAVAAQMWRTPNAAMIEAKSSVKKLDGRTPSDPQVGLADQAGAWPRPRAEDSECCGNHPQATDSLTGAVSNWKTPVANDAEKRGSFDAERSQCLAGEAQMWTTPQAHDTAKGDPARVGRYGTEHGGRNLTDEVMLWATPSTEDTGRMWNPETLQHRTEPGKNGEFQKPQVGLNYQVSQWLPPASSLPQEPAIGTDGPMCWCGIRSCGQPSHKRRLNPLFSAWLMGWPLHWANTEPTSCAASETESYLRRWRSHLSRLLSSTGSDDGVQMGLF
jgi:hypothetical protein